MLSLLLLSLICLCGSLCSRVSIRRVRALPDVGFPMQPLLAGYAADTNSREKENVTIKSVSLH